MIKERAMELVAALRSGNYVQAVGQLKNKNNEFCCLGVACDISGVGVYNEADYFVPKDDCLDRNSVGLPIAVQKHFGFDSADGATVDGSVIRDKHYSLADANDTGATFHQLADYIEKNWEIL